MINISGSLTIQDNTGQQYTINANDFNEDEHLDRTTSTFDYDTNGWSVKRTVENKNGAISWNDWEENNCSIINDSISFS
ncbi:MAG: hypothetical protein H0V01_04735 [Bacteroidetes bacterium]|nr:hypothetical protein [Bacteroidota bacterium]HET6242986.1 hypothetical protein [Bacteroidia bacterium]